MNAPLSELLRHLEVKRIDTYLFTGSSPERPRRIFGGQVLAQSLNAANRSIGDGRVAHSMHAHFLRPGNPAKQIVFEVDPTRDGRSFATRRVVAKQDGKPIFITSVSYQEIEDGLNHEAPMPEVEPPEGLQNDFDYWTEMAAKHPDRFDPPFSQAVERKVINRRDYASPQPEEPISHTWFRVPGDIGDDANRHQTLIAFISDFALLGAALLPHPYTAASKKIQAASLDHAIWFHRPGRADDYLLYSMDSPNAGGGRGFSRGQFFSRDGRLIASTAQESLIRLRPSSP
ncbi:acyl-CoA thioesterase [Congregibacter litoralis]|uniref:Acyl-CoA thioesterase 2 n=1 Tax=Congregibacter litoralis KT71 TaxID=314285 RepID=A4A5Q4_9GAMM|nr:acyl-CoA thioesterase II [Congregibacter litoralis]EAQ98351.1 Acyl-CoA thioesterase [Congregibacter litoralis KT71]